MFCFSVSSLAAREIKTIKCKKNCESSNVKAESCACDAKYVKYLTRPSVQTRHGFQAFILQHVLMNYCEPF